MIGIKLYCFGSINKPLGCPEHKTILEYYAKVKPDGIVMAHLSETGLAAYQSFAEYASMFPNLKFIAAHSGGMEWQLFIRAAKGVPNIYSELCCSNQFRSRVEDLVEAFGEDKVLFGTDIALISPEATLGTVFGADLPDETKRKILYENSKALFGLEV